MLNVFTLPPVAYQPVPPASLGIPIPARSGAGAELRRSLPPHVVEALDAVAAQVQAQVFDPLLYAANQTALGVEFQKLYPVYWRHHLSTALILFTAISDDLSRFAVLATRGLEESQDVVRHNGPRLIGQEAVLHVLFGLDVIKRVVQGVVSSLSEKTPPTSETAKTPGDEWAAQTVAYSMATSTVLFSISRGQELCGRLENVQVLARWSRGYAVNAYHLAKQLGFLKPTPPRGVVQSASDDEDLLLAEAGLEEYRRLLADNREK